MIMKRMIRLLRGMSEFIWQCFAGAILINNSPIAAYLRKRLYRTSCDIDTCVYITNLENFSSGDGSCIYHATYILNTNGKFLIGRNSHLGAFCYVNVWAGKVSIGDYVAVGPGTRFFAYSNHYRAGKKVTEEKLTADIIIKNNVFIGANCTILPGTIIFDNVIVGAGSVVKGQLESNNIYAGVPCKKVKSGWYE